MNLSSKHKYKHMSYVYRTISMVNAWSCLVGGNKGSNQRMWLTVVFMKYQNIRIFLKIGKLQAFISFY